ncbi:hypothetical protein SAMN02744102_04179 [Paenibacillus barengoltzii]|nr:hypothetical protein SAMN02744102_04179 [Paenibacillus barengoltzii]
MEPQGAKTGGAIMRRVGASARATLVREQPHITLTRTPYYRLLTLSSRKLLLTVHDTPNYF